MALRKKHAVQGGDAGRYVKVEKKKGNFLFRQFAWTLFFNSVHFLIKKIFMLFSTDNIYTTLPDKKRRLLKGKETPIHI